MNTYAYVGNNPLRWTDRLGLLPDCDVYLIGTRRNQFRDTNKELLRRISGLAFRSRPGIGPNLDPRTPGRIPLAPGLEWEVWLAEKEWWRIQEFLTVQVFNQFKSFCEDTITGECGRTETIRFESEHEELKSEEKQILRDYIDVVEKLIRQVL